MSSTNVHSEENFNIYCAGAQIIPTEKELEIPPKNAKRGPSSLSVELGEDVMEILAENSKMNERGELKLQDGTVVAKFDTKAFGKIKASEEKRKQATKTRSNKYEGQEI